MNSLLKLAVPIIKCTQTGKYGVSWKMIRYPYVSSKMLHNHPVNLQKSTPTKDVYLIDEQENRECKTPSGKVNTYSERSFTCNELRMEHVGLNVTLCGWLEFQRMSKFLVLRDGYGQTQCIISENDEKNFRNILSDLPYESVLKVQGTVVSRPENMVNERQSTGEIELLVSRIEVLNRAKNKLPFNIRDFQKAKESLRMQYRYLDMRFANMQRNMRVRSELCMGMREFLVRERGFVDIETPTLFKATPGGAQEFVVPTRFPDQFYSLVQSPQQFKQMLMAGAVDRYFQIARCYRDESSRPDRQPEFTQLDIEMSFTSPDGVINLVEDLLQHVWPPFLPPIPKTFPRISYDQAMETYGTDKPDTRYGFKLRNCTDILRLNPTFGDEFYASCLVFEEPFTNYTKSIREKMSMNQFPNTKFVGKKVKNESTFVNDTSKLFTEAVSYKLYKELNLKENSVIFLVSGDKLNTLKRLGKIREDYVEHLEENGHQIKQKGMNLLWVVDFPLFEPGDSPGTLCSAHHPFTAPNYDDIELLKTAPLKVRGQSYDLVLNGNEIAGGSARIHNPDLQKRVLDMLNIDSRGLQHMLDMLGSGCPPHGGIALGLDRLFSVILETPSIRDVIAFPKTFEGRDPISGAPAAITEEDKRLYHIKTYESK